MATELNEWISKENLLRLSWRASTRMFESLTGSRVLRRILAAAMFPAMILQLVALRSGGYLYQHNKAIVSAFPIRPGSGARYKVKLALLGGFLGFAVSVLTGIPAGIAEDSGLQVLPTLLRNGLPLYLVAVFGAAFIVGYLPYLRARREVRKAAAKAGIRLVEAAVLTGDPKSPLATTALVKYLLETADHQSVAVQAIAVNEQMAIAYRKLGFTVVDPRHSKFLVRWPVRRPAVDIREQHVANAVA